MKMELVRFFLQRGLPDVKHRLLSVTNKNNHLSYRPFTKEEDTAILAHKEEWGYTVWGELCDALGRLLRHVQRRAYILMRIKEKEDDLRMNTNNKEDLILKKNNAINKGEEKGENIDKEKEVDLE